MLYIFDNNTLSGIFSHYYRDSFPTFWNLFEKMVNDGNLLSVREVHNELKSWGKKGDNVLNWAKSFPDFFQTPTAEELQFITQIYLVPHFYNSISNKKLLTGGPFADPFIIAKAFVEKGTVVTEEKPLPNGAKIPNICEHFNIPYMNLQDFLKQNGWSF
jgi:hypothetical protein